MIVHRRRGPRPVAATILAAAVCVAGCRHRQRTPLERGSSVFMRACATCHGPEARGARPPGFSVAAPDLTDPALQARLSDAALRQIIRHGKGQMPPFGAGLAEQEVSDVIAFVRTLNRAATAPGTAGSAQTP